ncbi:Uncharacterised protein [Legionella londiniensis]|nr:Uncharacterised protein [Legionella londiniensis]
MMNQINSLVISHNNKLFYNDCKVAGAEGMLVGVL